MGVDCDFFGVLQEIRLLDSWKHLWQTSLAHSYFPANEMTVENNFGSFYRPILQYSHAIENYFLQDWWYGYTLVAIAFFGMTTGILAVIFTYAFPLFDALLLASLCAVHPALSPSLLSVTVLLSSAYFFIALSTLFYIFFYQHRKLTFLFGSLFFLFLALLSYDLLMIAPILLLLYLYFFNQKYILDVIPYFFINGICIGLRIFFMGTPPQKNLHDLSILIKQVLDNIIQVLRPFWGLEWTSTLIALCLTLLFTFLILMHWIQHKKDRQTIIWLLCSFIIGSWGIIVGYAQSRYFCLGLPFFAMLLYLLLDRSVSKKIVRGILILLIIAWGTRTFLNQANREKYIYARDIALHQLLNEYPSKQYFILTIPYFCKNEHFLLGTGIMQGLQLYSKDNTLKVYNIFNKIALYLEDFPSKGTLIINNSEHGYEIISTDPKNIWFTVLPGVEKYETSMGTVIIQKRKTSWQATELVVEFNDTYLQKNWINNTTFMYFDPHTWKFLPLQKDHLLKKGTR
jgi:hypothetical protein